MSKFLVIGLAAIGLVGLTLASNARAGDKAAGAVNHEFEMMDADKDGKLSADEHAAGAKKMFEMMDTDRNGRVTAAEMEASHHAVTGKKAKKADMSAADKIKVIDTNSDGAITAEEHTAGAKMMFEKMDTNKDGFLSKSELAAGHHKMMHKK